MRQYNNSEKKGAGWAQAGFGYVLIVIALYAIGRISSFVIAKIDFPANITNLGLVASVIMATLGATSLLLKMDMRSRIKHSSFSKKVIAHK